MRKYLLFIIIMASCCNSFAQQNAVFIPTPYVQTAGSTLDFICTGDVNGDGLTDIVGVTRFRIDPANDYQIYLWLQGANGEMQPVKKFPYSPGSSKIATALTVSDLYKDGTAEIIIGHENYVKIYSFANNNLVLEDSLITKDKFSPNALTTGDFDGDNLTDIGVGQEGGSWLTVMYQKGEANTKWDIRYYPMQGGGLAHTVAGVFGQLNQTALIYSNGLHTFEGAINIFTFTSIRTILQRYNLVIPVTVNQSQAASCVAIVKKGNNLPNELWAVYGGNGKLANIAVWRDLQSAPDSIIPVDDIPGSIMSDNLDCDKDDEPVVFHRGWNRVTVFTDKQDKYDIPHVQNFQQEVLALGDVNNDGRIDICLGGDTKGLIILYNNTPYCWPTDVADAGTAAKQLTIYPNPVNSNATVTYNGNGQLYITDAQGRSVHNTSFNQTATVDMAPWAAGIYFAILRTEDGQVWTKKLVKE